MYGCVIVPPNNNKEQEEKNSNDVVVVAGYYSHIMKDTVSSMSGHGIIAVTKVAIETGLVVSRVSVKEAKKVHFECLFPRGQRIGLLEGTDCMLYS
jgi:hypothetical protein